MIFLDIEDIKEARLTLALIAINIACYIAFNMVLPFKYFFLLTQTNDKIIYDSQYWRLFTAMFLHADAMHIFSNMIALLIFGAAVETQYKSKIKYLIIYFISGLIGNLFSLVLLPINAISLGASGCVFGLIGAAFVVYIREEPSLLLLGLAYLGYFLLTSLAPGINLWAHLFGLVGGLLLGYLFTFKREKLELSY